MSEREKASALLQQLPEYELGKVVEYLQELVARVTGEREDTPNAATVAALREGDEMLRNGTGQHFQGSAGAFFAMLDGEDNESA